MKLHNLYYLHVTKGCKLPRLSHYPLMSEPLQEKFEIFKTCPEVAKRQSLFKMQPPYKVGRKNSLKDPRRTEHDIMFEIQTHGPVQGKKFTYIITLLYIALASKNVSNQKNEGTLSYLISVYLLQ